MLEMTMNDNSKQFEEEINILIIIIIRNLDKKIILPSNRAHTCGTRVPHGWHPYSINDFISYWKYYTIKPARVAHVWHTYAARVAHVYRTSGTRGHLAGMTSTLEGIWGEVQKIKRKTQKTFSDFINPTHLVHLQEMMSYPA